MKFSSKHRKRWLRLYLGYIITEAFEEAEFLGKITREEKEEFYRRITFCTGILGLMPRRSSMPPDLDELKKAIKKRLRGRSKPRSLTMQTATILYRKKDQKLPADLLKSLLEGCSKVGFASPDGETITVGEWEPTEKDIVEAEDMFKDLDVLYSFHRGEGELLPEDVQPFTLKQKEIKKDKETSYYPTLVAFMDGGFIAYHSEDTPNSNARHAFHEWLKEEVHELDEGNAKGNVESLINLLEGPKFQRNVRNICIPRGVILFLAANGKIVRVEHGNKNGKDYEWGWVSNDVTTKSEPTKSEQPPDDRSLSPRERMEALKGKKVTQVGNTTIVHASSQEKPDLKTQLKESVASLEIDSKTMICPPEDAKSKNLIRWYRKHFGKNVRIPDDIRKGLPYHMLLPNSHLRLKRSFADLKQGIAESLQELEDEKDEPTPETTPKIPQGGVTTETLPIVHPDMKKNIMENVLPKMKFADPRVETIAKEVAALSEQCGYDLNDVLMWDLESCELFCNTAGPKAAGILIRDLCQLALEFNPDLMTELCEKKFPTKQEPMKELSPREKYRLAQQEKQRQAM